MIRMLGGWVFLLVPADQGSPRQRAVKRLLWLLSWNGNKKMTKLHTACKAVFLYSTFSTAAAKPDWSVVNGNWWTSPIFWSLIRVTMSSKISVLAAMQHSSQLVLSKSVCTVRLCSVINRNLIKFHWSKQQQPTSPSISQEQLTGSCMVSIWFAWNKLHLFSFRPMTIVHSSRMTLSELKIVWDILPFIFACQSEDGDNDQFLQ